MEYGYSVYETGGDTPGRIVSCGHASLSIHIMYQPTPEGTEMYPLELNANTQYVDVVAMEGKDRPRYFEDAYEIALDQELVVNIPADTKVRYNGEDFTSTGDPFEFSSSLPGSFDFEITPPWPGLKQTVNVRVA